MSRAAESEQGNSRCLAHAFPRLLCTVEDLRPGGRHRCQNGSRWTLWRRSVRLELFLALTEARSAAETDESCGWIISPCITPLRAVQVSALPSFYQVLILSVSSASSTPSFIGSTLWVFHHVSLPFSRSVNWTFFHSCPSGLSACHRSCVHAPRAPRVDCLVKSRVQTSHGGEGAWKNYVQ